MSNELVHKLLKAVPETTDARDLTIALGFMATAAICNIPNPEHRAEVVEKFCAMLRRGVARELN